MRPNRLISGYGGLAWNGQGAGCDDARLFRRGGRGAILGAMKRFALALTLAAATLAAHPALAAAGKLVLVSAAAKPVQVTINGRDYGKAPAGGVSSAKIAFSGAEAELPAVLTPEGGAATKTSLWLSEETAVKGADGLTWCVKVGLDYALVMSADDCRAVSAK